MDPIASLTRFERYLLRVVSERGRAPFVAVVAGVSWWLSVGITTLLMIVTDADTTSFVIGLIISAVVPLVVAPAAAGCIAHLLQALATAGDELHHLAHTDSLTGVLSRRAFVVEGETLLAGAGVAHLVVMADVDQFKAVNDRHGHGTGDRALVALAHQLTGVVGDRGIVGRVGGDEFAAVIEFRTTDEVEAMRRGFAAAGDLDAVVTGLKASVGVAVVAERATLEDALVAADRALYELKRASSPVPSAREWEIAG